MMNKKEFIESQKDCASMLGKNLKEYQKNVEKVIVSSKKNNKKIFDNTLLEKLGLTQSDLKRRRMI